MRRPSVSTAKLQFLVAVVRPETLTTVQSASAGQRDVGDKEDARRTSCGL